MTWFQPFANRFVWLNIFHIQTQPPSPSPPPPIHLILYLAALPTLCGTLIQRFVVCVPVHIYNNCWIPQNLFPPFHLYLSGVFPLCGRTMFVWVCALERTPVMAMSLFVWVSLAVDFIVMLPNDEAYICKPSILQFSRFWSSLRVETRIRVAMGKHTIPQIGANDVQFRTKLNTRTCHTIYHTYIHIHMFSKVFVKANEPHSRHANMPSLTV